MKRRRLRRKIQKTHKTNFEGVYLRDGWMDSTEIWGTFHNKNGAGVIELQMHENGIFLVPV